MSKVDICLVGDELVSRHLLDAKYDAAVRNILAQNSASLLVFFVRKNPCFRGLDFNFYVRVVSQNFRDVLRDKGRTAFPNTFVFSTDSDP
jgi:hypothetical protein